MSIESFNAFAVAVGYVACGIGGLIVLTLLFWGAMELCWRQVRTAGLLNDVYRLRVGRRDAEQRMNPKVSP